MSDIIGKTIDGYTIKQRIGQGGMSTIYLARQESLYRDVALKMVNAPSDEETLTRFNREVEMMSQLQHPHIITVYDHGEINGAPYLTMSYVPGGSLKDLLTSQPLDLHEIPPLLTPIADALDYAHSWEVIHRDIKPGNILLDADRRPLLSDFGIARAVVETQDLTADSVVGTLNFLAPEMILQEGQITPAVDIYALGIMLYVMLTGQYPFDSESAAKAMWAHVNEPVPPITTFHPDLPQEMDAIVLKALAKTPDSRYQRASELARDVAAVADGGRADIAKAHPPAIVLTPTPTARIEQAVAQAIGQVVKIGRPDGGLGAGVLAEGRQVITALHVVDGAPGIYVQFRTGERIEADVIALEREMDLALLQLRGTPTAKITGHLLEDYDALEPGERLVAIGHPLGFDWSVTGGHYNGLRQPGADPLPDLGIEMACPLVQVDVSINPGNSGGPLVDTEGHMVGLAVSVINPQIASNIGFGVHAPEVIAFWKAHHADTDPLVAYSDGHHYAAGLRHSPLTGKPIERLNAISMPDADAIRYTCGHLHQPGRRFCPGTGKPIEPLASGSTITVKRTGRQVACRNCTKSFDSAMSHCPHCGKPRT